MESGRPIKESHAQRLRLEAVHGSVLEHRAAAVRSRRRRLRAERACGAAAGQAQASPPPDVARAAVVFGELPEHLDLLAVAQTEGWGRDVADVGSLGLRFLRLLRCHRRRERLRRFGRRRIGRRRIGCRLGLGSRFRLDRLGVGHSLGYSLARRERLCRLRARVIAHLCQGSLAPELQLDLLLDRPPYRLLELRLLLLVERRFLARLRCGLGLRRHLLALLRRDRAAVLHRRPWR
mmetsp:Transcript_26192/g.84236  ORF Transcript_26192/g.84236 Transcript_26192/m.84236 type:complete len:235 (-) Transcript_26192:605-1309(-)